MCNTRMAYYNSQYDFGNYNHIQNGISKNRVESATFPDEMRFF